MTRYTTRDEAIQRVRHALVKHVRRPCHHRYRIFTSHAVIQGKEQE